MHLRNSLFQLFVLLFKIELIITNNCATALRRVPSSPAGGGWAPPARCGGRWAVRVPGGRRAEVGAARCGPGDLRAEASVVRQATGGRRNASTRSSIPGAVSKSTPGGGLQGAAAISSPSRWSSSAGKLRATQIDLLLHLQRFSPVCGSSRR